MKKKKLTKRKKCQQSKKLFFLICILCLIILLGFGIVIGTFKLIRTIKHAETNRDSSLVSETEQETKLTEEVILNKAEKLAQTYDYESAISEITNSELYNSSDELQAKAAELEEMKNALVEIKPEDVTHIFYHSLVVDPSKAFVPGEAGYDGWQQWMTTIHEFDKITQSMYDKGYVLVSIHDLVKKTKDEAGNVKLEPQSIYLPEGKKAFVLSLDDLSYYHTYDNHGVASKLVLDDYGKPICEYIKDDGTIEYGDFDVVPRMDSFLEEHPDGCYKGARGIIALTGYDGVLGYRTDGVYSETHNNMTDIYYADYLQKEWLEKHPDFNYEKEVADAKNVADAMKAEGWEFASHTWGHKNIYDTTYDNLVRDTERWKTYVVPVVGETDTIIFAHGADITISGKYSNDDSKYTYLKDQGFDLYCNVDSSVHTCYITEDYFHQGRRNLDGYRIYYDSLLAESDRYTSDLFDAADILDPQRPLPVPEL